MNVFFAGGGTGGHLYPALAIARALVQIRPEVQPFFIGARRGIERTVLPATEFPHVLLDLHPLYRSAPWRNWRTVVGGLDAWREISALSATRKPALLVATGGYVAGVALQYARVHHIPYVLQEQNSHPGMTVRWFASGARQIHLGFPEGATLLKRGPQTTIIDSGNPIEPPPPLRKRPTRGEIDELWGFPPSTEATRTVLVFGGSQGAAAINAVVARWLDNPATHAFMDEQDIRLIWSTGTNAYSAFEALESSRVKVRPFINPMASAYAAADLAVARSGAMATAELSAWGIPMVLIPLPTAAADHQTANAKTLDTAGAALMIRQDGLNPEVFADTIQRLLRDVAELEAMHDAALQRARPHAADDIAQHLSTLLDSFQH